MLKKYIVRLSDAERQALEQIVRKLKGSSQKVRRAQVLLKADADGPAWTDAKIAEAYGCRTKTVENIRERLVTAGFESDAQWSSRMLADRSCLTGDQEAQVIATRLGPPPKGLSRTGRLQTAGGSHCRTADGAGDQHADGPSHAKKNEVTGRKLEYWVIPPAGRMRSSWRGWKRCWTCTKGRMNPSGVPWCAWTSSRCSC